MNKKMTNGTNGTNNHNESNNSVSDFSDDDSDTNCTDLNNLLLQQNNSNVKSTEYVEASEKAKMHGGGNISP